MTEMTEVRSAAGVLFVHLPCGGTTWLPRHERVGRQAVDHQACDVCNVTDGRWHRVWVQLERPPRKVTS